MALGALASQIAARVLREAAILVSIGLLLGFGAAWWLGRYVQAQLYGVTPADTTTILLAGVSLTVVAAVAAMVPARRASRIAPMSALRMSRGHVNAAQPRANRLRSSLHAPGGIEVIQQGIEIP
jgi:ABC-type antimicrobial peptide transport system permease subunit